MIARKNTISSLHYISYALYAISHSVVGVSGSTTVVVPRGKQLAAINAVDVAIHSTKENQGINPKPLVRQTNEAVHPRRRK